MKRRVFVAAMPALLAAAGARAADAASAAAPASAASAASASGRRYVALSLVGDKLTSYTPSRETGSQMAHVQAVTVALTGGLVDRAALEGIAAVLDKADASAPRSFIAGGKPEFYANQDDWFSGDHAKLPDELARGVAGEHATHLVLLTKIRTDTSHLVRGRVEFGHGRILGLGVYGNEVPIDVNDKDAQVPGVFVIFAMARLSLVDLATSRVVGHQDIEFSQLSQAMTSAALLQAISDGLARGIAAELPKLLAAA